MTYFVEIRPTVRRAGPPKLVPLGDVANYRGFRSVFAFDEAQATAIMARGAMRDLRGEAVYAEELFMDFDGHQPDAFREWLKGSELAWQEFDSGNRSVHFHIPIVPVAAVWLPEAMKLWTKTHAPTADISFLHPAGQYRLVGTYHPKQPGRRKELVAVGVGTALTLIAPPPRIAAFALEDESSTREQFFSMLLIQKDEGGRRPWIWQCATTGAEAGLTVDEVMAGLLAWNARFCHPPHEPQTIFTQVESAFRRLAARS